MSDADRFFDTSVLLYLLSADALKADRVEQLLAERGTISVQVLNEFAVVALRKLRMKLRDIREILDTVRAVCNVEALTVAEPAERDSWFTGVGFQQANGSRRIESLSRFEAGSRGR
jgi:predicted nucleic acid-binding protein